MSGKALGSFLALPPAFSSAFSAACSAAFSSSLSGGFTPGRLSSSSGWNGKRLPGCNASAYRPVRLSNTGPILRSPQGEPLDNLKLRSDKKYSQRPSVENTGEPDI